MMEQQQPKAKLFVGTPMYGGLCNGMYTMGMIQSVQVFAQHNVMMYYSFMQNESLITRGRNSLAHDFLSTDATHLMFIDADIGFDGEAIAQLMLADKDICCGIYPKKEVNWESVERAAQGGKQGLEDYAGAFVFNMVGDSDAHSDADGCIEVRHGGTGFMLIKREVFEQLKDHVPTYVNDTHDLSGALGADRIHEFFATSIEPIGERLLSEDYHFCKIWRDKCEGTVWAAPWAGLSHIGTHKFDGILTERPQLPQPKAEEV